MKDRLTEIYKKAFEHLLETGEPFSAENYADFFLANGVTIPVRCKDCKYYTVSPMGGGACQVHFNGRTELIPRKDDDFCSYGQVKE